MDALSTMQTQYTQGFMPFGQKCTQLPFATQKRLFWFTLNLHKKSEACSSITSAEGHCSFSPLYLNFNKGNKDFFPLPIYSVSMVTDTDA